MTRGLRWVYAAAWLAAACTFPDPPTADGDRACARDADCPGRANACERPQCSDEGACIVTIVPRGDACLDGMVCDGDRNCVACLMSSDCGGGDEECKDNVCEPAHCRDDTLSPEETDVDCGGGCAPCAIGSMCDGDADCQSETCDGGLCVACSATECQLKGEFCNDDNMCEKKRPDGQPCTNGSGVPAGDRCESGFCRDGTCCADHCTTGVGCCRINDTLCGLCM